MRRRVPLPVSGLLCLVELDKGASPADSGGVGSGARDQGGERAFCGNRDTRHAAYLDLAVEHTLWQTADSGKFWGADTFCVQALMLNLLSDPHAKFTASLGRRGPSCRSLMV